MSAKHPSLILQFEVRTRSGTAGEDTETRVQDIVRAVIDDGGYRRPFGHGIALHRETLSGRLPDLLPTSIFAVTELIVDEKGAEALRHAVQTAFEAADLELLSMTSRATRAESVASHVVLFVGPDPGWIALPQEVLERVERVADEEGIALTTATEFHVYRNCQDMVDSAREEQSVGLIAIAELAAKAGDRALLDRFMEDKIATAQAFFGEPAGSQEPSLEYALVILH